MRIHTPLIATVCTGSSSLDLAEMRCAQQYLATHHHLTLQFHQDTFQRLCAKERANALLTHFHNKKISAIWAYQGGEGTADLLPYLAEAHDQIRALPPKILLGFSDFTPLLNYFSARYAWPTMHAPNLRQVVRQKVTRASAQKTFACLQQAAPITLNNLRPLNTLAAECRTLSAYLCGGNLSLLSLSIGDSWQIDCTNKIIIIEDVGEKAHKVRRNLNYLMRINAFKGAKAILLGDFIHGMHKDNPCKLQENAQYFQKTLQTFAQTCSCPVLITDAFGHGPENAPLPFFAPTTLTLGAKATLSIGAQADALAMRLE